MAAGHQAEVVSAGGRLVGELVAAGASHHTLAIGTKRPWVIAAVPRLAALINDLDCDVVYLRSRLPAWLHRLARPWIRSRPMVVANWHGLHRPGLYSGVLLHADHVVAVSETVRGHLLAYWPQAAGRALTVLPRGADLARFKPPADRDALRARLAEAHRLDVDRPWLLFPARLRRRKGHHGFIEVLARWPDAHGLVLGDVAAVRRGLLAELVAAARVHGVESRLHWLGYKSAVADWMGAADLVLQLAVEPEAYGRVVIEALACGTPVVGYAHGGVGELLAEHYSAGAVPLADVAGVVDRARALCGERVAINLWTLDSRALVRNEVQRVEAWLGDHQPRS